jgi:release factor glutamine methyltransferase
MSDAVTVRRALAQSSLVPLEAQVLLAHVLGNDRSWLIAHADDVLPQQELALFVSLARRRLDGEPVAYLTGTREFHSLALTVTRDVLIPRPETETLVDAVLAHLPPDTPARVLDLGTGSGAIALAIAHARPRADILGIDQSAAALLVANGNAQRLGIGNVLFEMSDWYSAVGDAQFDVIVANPPYIGAGDPHLGEGDLRHEPRAALTPGSDGLSALAIIVAGAARNLVRGGMLAVEHGYDQSDAVRALFARHAMEGIVAHRDLAGHWRVMTARRCER